MLSYSQIDIWITPSPHSRGTDKNCLGQRIKSTFERQNYEMILETVKTAKAVCLPIVILIKYLDLNYFSRHKINTCHLSTYF